jgi:hypothetical protein
MTTIRKGSKLSIVTKFEALQDECEHMATELELLRARAINSEPEEILLTVEKTLWSFIALRESEQFNKKIVVGEIETIMDSIKGRLAL